MRAPLLFGLALLVPACRSPFPDVPDRGSDGGAARFEVEPGDAAAAPRTLRIRIAAARPEDLDADAVHLFRGELSAYYLGRIKRDDLPSTLRARELPTIAWRDPADPTALVLAPGVALTPGEPYSVASSASGLLGVLRVSLDAAAPLDRIWPPLDAGATLDTLVFCGDGGVSLATPVDVTLDPGTVSALALPGVDDQSSFSDECLRVEIDGGTETSTLAPPVGVGAQPLDPAFVVVGAPADGGPTECVSSEQAFGPGCLALDDDRLRLRTDEPVLWSLRIGDRATLAVSDGSSAIFVRDLAPGSGLLLEASVLDLGGRRARVSAAVTLLPAHPHLVIDEVLANPRGSEPTQEWVELTNDGTLPVDLAGYSLADTAGESVLPMLVLEPGARALVVGEGFAENPELDVAPEPGTPLVRVASVGTRGLANDGEPLQLRAPDGSVVSRFPALAQPEAGASAARRHPWSSDNSPADFALHSPPGASPGAPNTLR